jgi:hypothetical protein
VINQYEGLKHTDDRHDPTWLAQLLSLDILPEAWIYPKRRAAEARPFPAKAVSGEKANGVSARGPRRLRMPDRLSG